MDEMERMARFSIIHADKLRNVCTPLYQSFGIKYFWCSKTFSSGKFICISSNPELHEYYYASKSYLSNPFFRAPELIHPGFYLHKNYCDNNYKQVVDRYINKFKTEFCAVFLTKNEKELIRFGYASDSEKYSFTSHKLLNNVCLLKKFNEYFLYQTYKLFSKGEEYFVNLKNELGNLYNEPSITLPFLNKEEKFRFLDKLGLLEKSRIEKLSQQELHCMKYLSEGFTTPMIALSMGISPRTAEHYLESIKNKLLCDTKVELFQYSNLLVSSGEL